MGFTKLLSKLSLTILISIKYAKLVGFTILISYFFSYYSYLALICILLLLVQNLGGSHPTHATIRSRKAWQRVSPFKQSRLQRFSTLALWYHVKRMCGSSREPNTENIGLMESLCIQYMGERERESKHKTLFKIITLSLYIMSIQWTLLYKSFTDWQKYW